MGISQRNQEEKWSCQQSKEQETKRLFPKPNLPKASFSIVEPKLKQDNEG